MSPADKLRKVADFVAGLDLKLFDMRSWVKILNWDDKYSDALNQALMGANCGTTACFLGWATVVFPTELSIHEHRLTVINTQGDSAMHSGRLLFNLTNEEADQLFSPTAYQQHRNAVAAGNQFDILPHQQAQEVKTEVVRRARELADKVEERSHVTS